MLAGDLAAPPAEPDEGDRYIVGADATGAWEGHDGEIAAFLDGAWIFAVPGTGWLAFDGAGESVLVRHAGSWLPVGTFLGALARLGVNIEADDTNRLAVRSEAALLTALEAAEGGTGDIRLLVNKEDVADTASLVFQSGFSGRAEIGLAGDEDFLLKVSGDGVDWIEAIRVAPSTGIAAIRYDNGGSGLAATTLGAAVDELAAAKLPLAGGTMTGALVLAGDPDAAMKAATKQYVDQIIAAQDAMVFKGVIDCAADPGYPAAERGWTYRVSVAGRIGGAAGVAVEAGDILLCLSDGTASGDQAAVGSAWSVAQANLDGAVIGPASATDGHLAQFDGASGRLLKGGKAAPAGDVVGTTDVQTLANKTLTAPAISAPTGLTKADVGLGNVLNYAQRDKLAANRTYYVRSDGSDGNDGLANTTGGAFATLQKAVDAVAALDRSIYGVTVSIGAGSFAGCDIIGWGPGSGQVTFSGAGTGATTVSATGDNCFEVTAAKCHIQTLKLEAAGASGSCIRTGIGADVSFSGVEFGAAINTHVWAEYTSRVRATGNYAISGGATAHVLCRYNATFFAYGLTITLTGTPAFSSAFAQFSSGGAGEYGGHTFSGAATGARYAVTSNAVLSVSGGGASYLPGSSAGITNAGGQYL